MPRPKSLVNLYFLDPIAGFMGRQTTGGLLLFASAAFAIIMANSPLAEAYGHLWHHELSVGFDDFLISKTLHHWINDGLMAVFFFVIGLELKREVIGGELSNPKDAVLPIMAGFGGMAVPALVYLLFNNGTGVRDGWGIPMATDIAFALGIVYLLGSRVPVALKVFLTALAIADDLGAVLVIAFFYTSNIDFASLAMGAVFMGLLVGSNLLGIRNVVWYGLLGIGGLWLAFLMSGVHATIAAVLAAFTIPANVSVSEQGFIKKSHLLIERFKHTNPNNLPLVTDDQLHLLEEIRALARKALTPLQRLEHAMHPFVAFVVIPLFALANAGITFPSDPIGAAGSVALGTFLGLLVGKFVGIIGIAWLLTKAGWCHLPEGCTWRHMHGAALLASVGFTMSLFITSLAFKDPALILQAKLGILAASLIGGFVGYFVLKGARAA